MPLTIPVNESRASPAGRLFPAPLVTLQVKTAVPPEASICWLNKAPGVAVGSDEVVMAIEELIRMLSALVTVAPFLSVALTVNE